MAIKLSTGLRNSILVTNSLKALLDGKVLKLYSGTVPGTADEAVGAATLICTVSNNATATGLTFDGAPVNATLFKTAAEIWRGVNAVSGNLSFYRFAAAADAGAASTTEQRVQGTIGAGGGADMNLSSVALVAGANQNIDFYSVELPTA